MIIGLSIIFLDGNHTMAGIWPRPVDEEVMWLIDMAHERFELELRNRHPRHNIWCMPLVRGEDRIQLYVQNEGAMGNFPSRDIAESMVVTFSEFMEDHRANLDMDYVTNDGRMAVRLEYWSVDPPLLFAVSGETACSAVFRLRYYYRNRFVVNSLTIAMLDR